MFPTLLLLVLALFVVRGCGSWLYHVTVEAGDALLWEGMGLLLPPGRAREARTKGVLAHISVSASNSLHLGGEQVHRGCGPLLLLHLALRAPGDRYTGRVGGPWDRAVLPGHLIISFLIFFQELK